MSNAKIRHRRQRRARVTEWRRCNGQAWFWGNAFLPDGAKIDALGWQLAGDVLRVRLTATKLAAIENVVVNGTIRI